MDSRITSFNTILGLHLRINAVDVGASGIDGAPLYAPLLARDELDVVGFEPDPSSLASLNAQKGPHETYLPYVVGDGGEHTLQVCRSPGMTSLLEPNRAIFPFFHGFSRWGEVVERVAVKTTRLDDIAEVKALDYLKIDVQGAELMVLQNAPQRLSECVVIQTEVEFLPLYMNQPLFSEVEQYLRSQGFVFHCFVPAPSTRMVSPMILGNDPMNGLSQVFDSDVVFVRDFTRPDAMTSDQMLRMAMILHDIYGSYDVALRLLLEHDRRFGGSLCSRYSANLIAVASAPDSAAA
jgi:FkbM family methyltransferase